MNQDSVAINILFNVFVCDPLMVLVKGNFQLYQYTIISFIKD